MITEDGIAPDPEKVAADTDWPTPTTEKQLRGFLGLAGYYRRFIQNFAKIASPLHAVTGGPLKKRRGRERQFKTRRQKGTSHNSRTKNAKQLFRHSRNA